MDDGDDAAPAIALGVALQRPADAVDDVEEAFAAGRPMIGRRQPVAVPLTGSGDLGQVHGQIVVAFHLPFAVALFGQVGLDEALILGYAGGGDGIGGLLGALKAAGKPHCIIGQPAREGCEHGVVGDVGRHVTAAVEKILGPDHRRMPDQPPPGAFTHLLLTFVWKEIPDAPNQPYSPIWCKSPCLRAERKKLKKMLTPRPR